MASVFTRLFMAIESKMNRGPIGRPGSNSSRKYGGAWTWIAMLVVIAFLGGAWYYFSESASSDPVTNEVTQEEEAIRSGEYQAVFLDNGQVYFGKLERTREFYSLTDVFYLQSGTVVEQSTNISLTKLGSEAHGPEDGMLINPEHILFIEDLSDSSKVVQAIQQYKSKK
jgi:hypothetical protein